MRRIVHHELGEPAQVLRVEGSPSASLGPDQVRVRVSYAPIHPGDLLGIMGSPAFGTPPTIGSVGRVPGFEGAGVVSEVGARIDPGLGLKHCRVRQGRQISALTRAASYESGPGKA
jgi:NADPH:quinone reductase